MLLSSLLAPAAFPPAVETASQWRAHWLTQQLGGESPFEMAIRAGSEADRLSWAFAGGYQAALAAALPHMPRDAVGSLCATEPEGNRPRHIHSRLFTDTGGQLRVTGHKLWSLAPAASRLWVLVRDARSTENEPSRVPETASSGKPHAIPERIALKLVLIQTEAPGVRVTPMPPTSFMPDLPHAELHFENVAVQEADVLAGDGYADFVKPFRTLEDIYVTTACLTHLLRQVRRHGWPDTLVEDMLGALHALQQLARQPASAPGTHIALAGVLRTVDHIHAALDAHAATTPSSLPAQRWQRDRRLFGLSAKTRHLRTQRAWAQLAADTTSTAHNNPTP